MGRIIKRLLIFIIAIIVILTLSFAAFAVLTSSGKPETDLYHLHSDKIAGGQTVRVIVLSDLHNEEFGENNKELIAKVERLGPDLIIIAGDLVDKSSDRTDIAINLCTELGKIAPLYYGYGNHESTMEYVNGIPYEKMLHEAGIQVLINNSTECEVKGTRFVIGAVATDEENFHIYSKDFMDEFVKSEDYKLLITHYPSLFYEILADADIDLSIASHYHGGQIRLPFVGGLYSVAYGLFPKYCEGMFTLRNGELFVSRGLGNHEKIPRINNNPQIAVIDINAR